MTLPDYLTNNVNRIRNIPAQNLGSWSANYNHRIFDDFSVMSRLREQFPQNIIHRSDVITLFENGDKYLAFIAAMVWGIY